MTQRRASPTCLSAKRPNLLKCKRVDLLNCKRDQIETRSESGKDPPRLDDIPKFGECHDLQSAKETKWMLVMGVKRFTQSE